jgi:hypothetical protein
MAIPAVSPGCRIGHQPEARPNKTANWHIAALAECEDHTQRPTTPIDG